MRRLRCFFSGRAHNSTCGQKHGIKAVGSFPLQALRTPGLTIDEVVRFDNKIHDVRSECDHTKSWAQKIRDCWLQQAGEEGVTWPNPVASKCTIFTTVIDRWTYVPRTKCKRSLSIPSMKWLVQHCALISQTRSNLLTTRILFVYPWLVRHSPACFSK